MSCTRHRKQPCGFPCSVQADKLAYAMNTNVPYFELEELSHFTPEDALARFEELPVLSLPVVDRSRVIGGISLRALAEALADRTDESHGSEPPLVQAFESLVLTVPLYLTIAEGIQVLGESSQTELFVVDSEEKLEGIFTSQLALRYSLSKEAFSVESLHPTG